jgi:flagellar motor component MotA
MKMQTKILIGIVIAVVLLTIGEIVLGGHFANQFAARSGN